MKGGTKNLTESELHYMETKPNARAIRIGRTKPYYLITKEKEIAKKKTEEKEMDTGRS